MRTLVVDDEPNARQLVRNILELYCENVEVVGEAENVKDGLSKIHSLKPDLVLLDIQMPDGTGFDLLKKCKSISFNFIFITAYEQYAIKAIKMCALDYILKPINTNELIQAVERAADKHYAGEGLRLKLDNYIENLQRDPNEKRIMVNTLDALYSIKVKDIIRCEADKNYTEVHLVTKKSLIVSKTLKEFEEMLVESGFFRTHQSHLINISFIDRYEKGLSGLVVLHDGAKVPVSSRRKDSFLQLLEKL